MIFFISSICFKILPITQPILHIPGRRSLAENQIVFKADLPALGFQTYYFQKTGIPSPLRNAPKSSVKITRNEACTLQNKVQRLVSLITMIFSLFFHY